MKKQLFLLLSLGFLPALVFAQSAVSLKIDQKAKSLEPKIIEWRRDFHEHPELGNRETRTAEKVAAHLKSLGIEVQTGVAHTGVVGLLKGGKPGPAVLLVLSRRGNNSSPLPCRHGSSALPQSP